MTLGVGFSLYLEQCGLDPGLGLLVASVSALISSNVFLSIQRFISYAIAKALDKLPGCPLWQILPVIYR